MDSSYRAHMVIGSMKNIKLFTLLFVFPLTVLLSGCTVIDVEPLGDDCYLVLIEEEIQVGPDRVEIRRRYETFCGDDSQFPKSTIATFLMEAIVFLSDLNQNE